MFEEKKNFWTGFGCDLCGFGTVENVDEFDPFEPCPDCGTVTLSRKEEVLNGKS